MKKFVVTGGSGFIGSNLVKFLLRKNYFVINIDKMSYAANPYNLKKIIKNQKYRFFKQDINNQTQIYNILNRFKPHGIFNQIQFPTQLNVSHRISPECERHCVTVWSGCSPRPIEEARSETL